MSEVADHVLEQQEGEQALTLITGIIRALDLYDPNNDTIVRLLQQLTEVVQGHIARGNRGLIVQVDGENCFVNETLLKLDSKSFSRLDRLRQVLERLDINEIELYEGLSPESLTIFFS